MTDRVYAIHSDEECERLEAQARLAPISSHLKYLRLKPGMSVLDAGCGSGSMTRQIAAAESGATVVGVDLREPYLDFARQKAESENLTNATFEKGDVRALPFPDATLTSFGRIDAERRSDWEIQFKAGREHAIKHLGSAAMADAFTDRFMRYQDHEDTASYSGAAPVSASRVLRQT